MRARVLIVDDNIEARDTIKGILSDFECDFTEAENVSEALSAINEQAYEVVFLDLKLPDGDGLDFLEQARALREGFGKVIVLTGQPREESRRRSAELGAIDYR